MALLATACGNSADPTTWAEAEEFTFVDPDTGDAYTSAVEFNFMTACLLANEEASGGNLTPEEAQVLCQCSFVGLRQQVSLQEFRDLDRALRDSPNPSDLNDEGEEGPEHTWDDIAEGVLEDCARRVNV